MAEYGKKRLNNTSDDPRLVKLDGQDSPVAKSRWKAARSHIVNMFNEKQSPDNESEEQSLTGLFKTVAGDEVIPSLNSPGNLKHDSDEKKAISYSCPWVGQNAAKSPSPDVGGGSRGQQTYGSGDHLREASNLSTEPRDHLGGSTDQNSNTHAVSSHRGSCDKSKNEETGVSVSKTERNKAMNTHQMRGNTHMSRTRQSVTRQPRDISSCLNTLDYLKAVLQSTMVSYICPKLNLICDHHDVDSPFFADSC